VDHLHRFARDTGEVRIDRVSLHDCVKNALRLVRPKAARAGIAIVHQIPTDVCVLADANKLEQVFINLLTNCIEFCRNGASVTITESPEKRGPRFFRLLVSDNGPGMPPAVLAKVFDPFFTTKEVGKGIGLGLAMCHRIMEELNGHIDIVSEKGAGTTVLLEIPYAL
jgi:two-component system C4-dicarboxylate transport sensor histidine kinase DctB